MNRKLLEHKHTFTKANNILTVYYYDVLKCTFKPNCNIMKTKACCCLDILQHSFSHSLQVALGILAVP